uniref:Uncharacterized protein n=1 Tax=Ursus maritimus TaxID=29073 RepID=A0A452V0Y7_URSMA
MDSEFLRMEAQSARPRAASPSSPARVAGWGWRLSSPARPGDVGTWGRGPRGQAEARPAKRPMPCVANGHGFLGGKEETRKIPVPGNRHTPLKENWMRATLLVEHLGLQVGFTLKARTVEIRTCKDWTNRSS